MDYESGKLIAAGDFGACNQDGEDYCVADGTEIKKSNVDCKEGQDELAQCGGKETQDCDAKMTAVVECVGEKGDSSGLN